MNRTTLGAIDIGSNAVRILISYLEYDHEKRSFKKALFVRIPLRLGADVFTLGEVGERKKEQFVLAMQSFNFLMQTFNVKEFKAYATSAMREARNSAEIIATIAQKCDIGIEIISGEQEAKTIFEAGEMANLMAKDGTLIYLDVGGGSSEVTIYSDHKRVTSASFALGSVRSISGTTDEGERQRFKNWLAAEAKPLMPTLIICSGGNINRAFKMLKRSVNQTVTYVELKMLYSQIKEMSYHERQQKLGLNTYRADVIAPALKIFLTAAKVCKINELIAPRIGLCDGIIHQLATSANHEE